MAGSKILVTSRSRKVLTSVLQSRYGIMHIPSLTEAEAVEALKSYCGFSCFIPEEHLQSLAHSCFFQGQCHPLYLKLKGAELEIRGRASFNGHKWKETISSMVSNGGNHGDSSGKAAVLRAVEKSLDVLPSHLQDFFINLVSWEHVFKNKRYSDGHHLDYLRFHCNDGTEDAMFNVLELEYHGLVEVGLDATDSLKLDRLVIHDLLRDVAMRRLKSIPEVNALANHVVASDNLSGFSSFELASKKNVTGRDIEVSTLSTLFGSRKAFGSNWLGCWNLEVHAVVGAATDVHKWSRSLVKVGDCLPKLQVLKIDDNEHLVEVAAGLIILLSDTFPILKRLKLRSCRKLERFPDLIKLGSLRTLDLSYCSKLRSMEGSMCSLTGLQELDLVLCDELEIINLDLSNSANLRVLRMDGCMPVREIRLSMTAACVHLQHLSFHMGGLLAESSKSSTSVPSLLRGAVVLCDNDYITQPNCGSSVNLMNPFVNLRSLDVKGCRWHIYWLDVSGLPSLQELQLASFESLQKLTLAPDSLVNLRYLNVQDCRNLEEISGLGAGHRSLRNIRISKCPTLVRILGMHDLRGLSSLSLKGCEKTKMKGASCEQGDTCDARIDMRDADQRAENGRRGAVQVAQSRCMAALASLQELDIWCCTALTDVSAVAALTSLQELDIRDCTALTDVSAVAALITSLRTLHVKSCTALRFLNLKHLPCLEVFKFE
ncbi:hypothetical protein GOP47_0025718 [Adiantum capillus-veneris]|uniref:Uncharacterized protein n=1 Tax=Adiantum capillus-veneris TaxID=13818 RepID=A0A9D4U2L0_ADICA|nr:hypothetical protein GOP47_0025718 [Adiantum capillus-veneris]